MEDDIDDDSDENSISDEFIDNPEFRCSTVNLTKARKSTGIMQQPVAKGIPLNSLTNIPLGGK